LVSDLDYRDKNLEAALRLAAIVESSQDAIISKDLKGIIKTWNKSAEKLFGYTADEIIGKPVLVLIPKDRHHEEDTILGRIRKGELIEHFETVRQHKDGSLRHISLTVSPIKDTSGKVIGASKIARDIGEKKRADDTRDLLLNEIKHRVKNTLATVQAVASQSFKSASTEEHRTFSARLRAMAESHDLLTQNSWQSVSMTEIAERALRPFRDGREKRLTVQGPDVELPPNKALLVAMVLHELGTNAVKYGALSTDQGQVELTWTKTSHLDREALELCWKEAGGPPVTRPTRKGFGSLMIERAMKAEGGFSKMEFESKGLICQVTVPVGWQRVEG
jgi:PAS domain S-box-containing protein